MPVRHLVRAGAVLALCAIGLAAPVLGDEPSRFRRVAVTGDAAPSGGTFDRFGAESMPIVAPVNARGDVAFFATLSRGGADEGLFLWSRGRLTAVAREGDRVAGIGRLSGFGKHPIPALSDDGTVVFAAAITGGRAVEGIFAAQNGRVRPIAVSGAAAPGVTSGVLASLDAPAVNAKGDVAFLATVRRGRENLEAVLVSTRGQLQKIVAQGDPAPAGGAFAGFGPPALNRDGTVAFGAAIEGRAVPGGIFVWKAGQLRMVLGAGDETPIGGIFAKFSERLGFGDQGTIAFHGQLKAAPVAAGIFAIDEGRDPGRGAAGRRRTGRRYAVELRVVAGGQHQGCDRVHGGRRRRAEPGDRRARGRRRAAPRRRRGRQRARWDAHRLAHAAAGRERGRGRRGELRGGADGHRRGAGGAVCRRARALSVPLSSCRRAGTPRRRWRR